MAILLDNILKEGLKVKAVAKRNAKKILQETLKEDFQKFMTESSEYAATDDEFDENEVGADVGDDIGGDDVPMDGEDGIGDDSIDDVPMDDEAPIGDDEFGNDVPMDGEDEIGDSLEQVDLTNMDINTVMDYIQNNIESVDKIEVVKNPATYDIEVGSDEAPIGADEFGGEDIPTDDEIGGEEEIGGEDTYEDEEEEEEIATESCDTQIEESDELNDFAKKSVQSKSDKNAATVLEAYKNLKRKALALQKGLRSVVKENKILKGKVSTFRKREGKYKNTINESFKILKDLSISNANLVFVSKLFNEQTLTILEKETILEKFDEVNTVKEGQLLYTLLQENFSKVGNKKIKNPISISKTKGKVIKESVVREEVRQFSSNPQMNKDLSKINKLMNFKGL